VIGFMLTREFGRGPFPADEMRRLALVGDISDDTLCWCSQFGDEWKPFSETELYVRPPTDPTLPPPLPADQISNRYAWIYAFVPLVGAPIQEAVTQNSTEPDAIYPWLWFPYVIAYGVLAGLDSRMIARSGNHPKGNLPNAWWFLFAHVTLNSARRIFGLGLSVSSALLYFNYLAYPAVCF